MLLLVHFFIIFFLGLFVRDTFVCVSISFSVSLSFFLPLFFFCNFVSFGFALVMVGLGEDSYF